MYHLYDTKIDQYNPNKDIHFWYGHSVLHFPPILFDTLTQTVSPLPPLQNSPKIEQPSNITQIPEKPATVYKSYRYRYKERLD